MIFMSMVRSSFETGAQHNCLPTWCSHSIYMPCSSSSVFFFTLSNNILFILLFTRMPISSLCWWWLVLSSAYKITYLTRNICREAALAMVEEETRRYRPTKNYLEHLPGTGSFFLPCMRSGIRSSSLLAAVFRIRIHWFRIRLFWWPKM